MFRIRRMRAEDMTAVAELEKKVFPDAWSERAIQETYEQPHTLILTAFEDKKLIGYVILYMTLEDAEISRIAVDEAYRRQKVASKILRELKLLCADNGISKLLLEVRESNADARAFYEEMGFTIDGVRKNYYTMPVEHAVLMSLELE